MFVVPLVWSVAHQPTWQDTELERMECWEPSKGPASSRVEYRLAEVAGISERKGYSAWEAVLLERVDPWNVKSLCRFSEGALLGRASEVNGRTTWKPLPKNKAHARAIGSYFRIELDPQQGMC